MPKLKLKLALYKGAAGCWPFGVKSRDSYAIVELHVIICVGYSGHGVIYAECSGHVVICVECTGHAVIYAF